MIWLYSLGYRPEIEFISSNYRLPNMRMLVIPNDSAYSHSKFKIQHSNNRLNSKSRSYASSYYRLQITHLSEPLIKNDFDDCVD